MEKTFYYHSEPMEKGYRTTVAGRFEDNIFKVGVSVCTPADNFSKKIGRKIAENRLINKPFKTLNLDSNANTKVIVTTLESIAKEVLNEPKIVNGKKYREHIVKKDFPNS